MAVAETVLDCLSMSACAGPMQKKEWTYKHEGAYVGG